MEKLEGIRISEEDYQINLLELRRRKEEIYKLQKEKTDINDALFSEKKLLILLNSELEYYKSNFLIFLLFYYCY
jgi:hypothetical protein